MTNVLSAPLLALCCLCAFTALAFGAWNLATKHEFLFGLSCSVLGLVGFSYSGAALLDGWRRGSGKRG
ncbi:hypothetical protein [Duganella vulcania]|uniref:Uncharacterized protein n=1 Tax=Duganella vulcania TaxID=2692166 RepID=A0A845GGB9_9BURK|nr:hypothetical protein [Duganella vulcania]MYM92452.1 hypothetical protein [Duganella vulcania]